MEFYLGTHKPGWLWNPAAAGVPLCVSYRQLRDRKRLQPGLMPWILDSGGFTELARHGRECGQALRYTIDPRRYVADVARYSADIGGLAWASPQDWMCEPAMTYGGGLVGKVTVPGTGLSARVHQHLTVLSYVSLCGLWREEADGPCPFIPVLQGWTLGDYEYCRELYAAAGVDLAAAPAVGLGSVCRRQGSLSISVIAGWFASYGYALHGFGVKTDGLALYGRHLASADSMAWAYDAYRLARPGIDGHTHQTCSNCLPYALRWREGHVPAGVHSAA